MASGASVITIVDELPPGSAAAYLHQVAGASSPAERLIYWRFDEGSPTVNYLDLKCVMHNYSGGGITLRFYHDTQSGTAGNNVRIGAAFRRIADDVEDLDTTAQTYDFNDATFTTSSVRGELAYDTITFTDGADMDSVANNETFILRIRRQPGDAADTLAGNWLLWAVSGTET